MTRQSSIAALMALAALTGAIAVPDLLMGAAGAVIEKLEIGLSGSGTVGHDGDGVLRLGDGIDDAVRIQSGAGDPTVVTVDAGAQAVTVSAIHSPAGKPGIVTLDHQSRARWSLSAPQSIVEALWVPIAFDFDPSLAGPDHFDEHAESTPGVVGVQGWSFTPSEAGYFQVNARTEFTNFRDELGKLSGDSHGFPSITPAGPAGGVSIAIFKNGVIHSQGNNAQVFAFTTTAGGGGGIPAHAHQVSLQSNVAPNVSDVVHLTPLDTLQILAWWDGAGVLGNTADLGGGPAELYRSYVSVHKLS